MVQVVEKSGKTLKLRANTETNDISAKLLDLAKLVVRTKKFRTSPFLDVREQEIAKEVAASCDEIIVEFDGGFEGAERKKAVLLIAAVKKFCPDTSAWRYYLFFKMARTHRSWR